MIGGSWLFLFLVTISNTSPAPEPVPNPLQKINININLDEEKYHNIPQFSSDYDNEQINWTNYNNSYENIYQNKGVGCEIEDKIGYLPSGADYIEKTTPGGMDQCANECDKYTHSTTDNDKTCIFWSFIKTEKVCRLKIGDTDDWTDRSQIVKSMQYNDTDIISGIGGCSTAISVDEWSEWGSCSKACGGGKRQRKCLIKNLNDTIVEGISCDGNEEECNTEVCDAGDPGDSSSEPGMWVSTVLNIFNDCCVSCHIVDSRTTLYTQKMEEEGESCVCYDNYGVRETHLEEEWFSEEATGECPLSIAEEDAESEA